MGKKVSILALSVLLAWQGMSFAASTVDSLVQKLVEKGILTDKEATQLKGEIAYQEKSTIEEGSKKQVPDWVQNFKITGDFRGRLQTERSENPGAAATAQGERVRARMRARLNFETKINDKAKVVIGIATDGGTGATSASSNARSNNYTNSTYVNGTSAGNSVFTKPYIVLNKAYGQYMFTDNLSVAVGKLENSVFYEPMEFLFDNDITPEGASVTYNYKLNSMITLTAVGNLFTLGEFNPSTSDPFMFAPQFIATIKPNDKLDIKAAFTYIGYGNIKSGFLNGNVNNTLNAANGSNGLKYDYSAPMGAIDIGINDPFGEMLPAPIYIPRVGVFGEYTRNPSAPDKNVAWMAGTYIGNSKVNGFGTWRAYGAYKVLGKDAWLDIFPDSDFQGGATGVKGIETGVEVGLAKNMSFKIEYDKTRRIDVGAASKIPTHLVQYDINWKF
ncbi:MAG: putative porin [Candidatus Omnitrophica bacterium]|nr:putative porin [Candidatus Omnitrophota bacterium]